MTAGSTTHIVLDNTIISTFQEARALELMLGLWPGRWLVPLEVRAEALRWRAHGTAVASILDRLDRAGTLALTALTPQSEGMVFLHLQRTLGQGESAVIAIAFSRGHGAALDDRRARRACERLTPPVQWLPSESILGLAVRECLLSRSEAEAIGGRTGITDPRRCVPISED